MAARYPSDSDLELSNITTTMRNFNFNENALYFNKNQYMKPPFGLNNQFNAPTIPMPPNNNPMISNNPMINNNPIPNGRDQ